MRKKDKKWKRKFIAFLKENGIYEKWIYNIKDQHPLTNYDWWNCFAETIYQDKCYEGINHTFLWSETRDGHGFWNYFDREWKSIVRNGIIGQEIL